MKVCAPNESIQPTNHVLQPNSHGLQPTSVMSCVEVTQTVVAAVAVQAKPS